MGGVTVLSYWPAVDAAFHISHGLWPRVTSENTETWKRARSIMLLVTWVSTQSTHFAQILSAWTKGKPHSPSTEHIPKANPTANLSQERQSWSTELWGGLGHRGLPPEQAPKGIPNCKTWEQTPPHLQQLLTEVLGTTEGHSSALQHAGSVHALLWNPAARTHGQGEISQEQHSSSFIWTPGIFWGKQKLVPQAPAVKRTRDKHTSTGSCWGFRPPLSLVLVSTLMPRLWGTGNAKTMLVCWPLSFPVLQKAESQVLAGWMPHMGIALQVNN